MFLLSRIRPLAVLLMIVLFVAACAPTAFAQCNAGISQNQQVAQANQNLVLQQLAAIQAQRTVAASQPIVAQPTFGQTTFVSQPSSQQLANCTTCQQAAAPAGVPRLVLSTTPAAPLQQPVVSQVVNPASITQLPKRYAEVPTKPRPRS
jgi:hypothetical protein